MHDDTIDWDRIAEETDAATALGTSRYGKSPKSIQCHVCGFQLSRGTTKCDFCDTKTSLSNLNSTAATNKIDNAFQKNAKQGSGSYSGSSTFENNASILNSSTAEQSRLRLLVPSQHLYSAEKLEKKVKGSESNNGPRTKPKDATKPDIIVRNSEIENVQFSPTTVQSWLYPKSENYACREYQLNIIKTALFSNTLVVLPTGLGKTFIAAVVMFNYLRWFPKGKIIFMAPTRPLVIQQIEACHNIVGIDEEITAQLMGNIRPDKRHNLWKEKRVFYCTPQTVEKDSAGGILPIEDIVLVVVDEAHRATGKYAYTKVVSDIRAKKRGFRVLALSATPGTDVQKVQEVVTNLLISSIEYKSESDPDVKPYVFSKSIEVRTVQNTKECIELTKMLKGFCQQPLNRLWQKQACSILKRDIDKVTHAQVIEAQKQFFMSGGGNRNTSDAFKIQADFGLLASLLHTMKLLTVHGISSMSAQITRNFTAPFAKNPSQVKKNLILSPEWKVFLQRIDDCKKNGAVNPKTNALFEILEDHFRRFKDCGKKTSVIVFTQYRASVGEIVEALERNTNLRVSPFVGQSNNSTKKKGDNKELYGLQMEEEQEEESVAITGQNQKAQQEVVRRFRRGEIDVLVATSIGEEGLDIGSVDLIVSFDALASPVRMIQRFGRAGRKRSGKVICLVAEGKEKDTLTNGTAKSQRVHKLLREQMWRLTLYAQNHRMIPPESDPQMTYHIFQIKTFHSSQIAGRAPEKKAKTKIHEYEKDSGDGQLKPLSETEEMYYRSQIFTSKNFSICSALQETKCWLDPYKAVTHSSRALVLQKIVSNYIEDHSSISHYDKLDECEKNKDSNESHECNIRNMVHQDNRSCSSRFAEQLPVVHNGQTIKASHKEIELSRPAITLLDDSDCEVDVFSNPESHDPCDGEIQETFVDNQEDERPKATVVEKASSINAQNCLKLDSHQRTLITKTPPSTLSSDIQIAAKDHSLSYEKSRKDQYSSGASNNSKILLLVGAEIQQKKSEEGMITEKQVYTSIVKDSGISSSASNKITASSHGVQSHAVVGFYHHGHEKTFSDDFSHDKNIRQNNPKRQEINKCAICEPNPNGLNEAIEICSNTSCNLHVHAKCYGITKSESSMTGWCCDSCQFVEEKDSPSLCYLCEKGKNFGPMKRFKNLRGEVVWMHLFCALWSKTLRCEYTENGFLNTKQPIPQLDENNLGSCVQCNSVNGELITCSDPCCFVQFHVSCARTSGFRFDFDPMFPAIYCAEHTKALTKLICKSSSHKDERGKQPNSCMNESRSVLKRDVILHNDSQIPIMPLKSFSDPTSVNNQTSMCKVDDFDNRESDSKVFTGQKRELNAENPSKISGSVQLKNDKKLESDTWTCAKCTLINQSQFEFCAACELKRPITRKLIKRTTIHTESASDHTSGSHSILCMNCKKSDRDEDFLLCDFHDGIEHGGHYDCFGLDKAPEGDWYCPNHNLKTQQESVIDLHIRATQNFSTPIMIKPALVGSTCSTGSMPLPRKFKRLRKVSAKTDIAQQGKKPKLNQDEKKVHRAFVRNNYFEDEAEVSGSDSGDECAVLGDDLDQDLSGFIDYGSEASNSQTDTSQMHMYRRSIQDSATPKIFKRGKALGVKMSVLEAGLAKLKQGVEIDEKNIIHHENESTDQNGDFEANFDKNWNPKCQKSQVDLDHPRNQKSQVDCNNNQEDVKRRIEENKARALERMKLRNSQRTFVKSTTIKLNNIEISEPIVIESEASHAIAQTKAFAPMERFQGELILWSDPGYSNGIGLDTIRELRCQKNTIVQTDFDLQGADFVIGTRCCACILSHHEALVALSSSKNNILEPRFLKLQSLYKCVVIIVQLMTHQKERGNDSAYFEMVMKATIFAQNFKSIHVYVSSNTQETAKLLKWISFKEEAEGFGINSLKINKVIMAMNRCENKQMMRVLRFFTSARGLSTITACCLFKHFKGQRLCDIVSQLKVTNIMQATPGITNQQAAIITSHFTRRCK